MYGKSFEEEIRDNIYRLKLATLKERVQSDNKNLDSDNDYRPGRMAIPSWVESRNYDRDLEMKQMSLEINAAKEKHEKLKNKLKTQKLQNKLAASIPINVPAAERSVPDRFNQYLEMLMVQQTQNQSMLMNQLLLKSQEEKSIPHNNNPPPNKPTTSTPKYSTTYPPIYPPIYPMVVPQFPPFDYSRYYPPPPPISKDSSKNPTSIRPKPIENNFPYPGNEAQQSLRQMGLAALFCAILESNYEENPVVLTEKFLFELKIKEIIISIQKYILKENGSILNLLRSMISMNAVNFRSLITNGNDSVELEPIKQELNVVLQNLISGICEIMPISGSIGCEGRSLLTEILQTNQTYPDQYFLARELDLIEVDSLNTVRNVGTLESKAILIGIFLLRSLVMTIMAKPIEYGWTTYLSTVGKDNLRILSSLLIRIYRMALADFIELKYPSPIIVERPPTITSPNANPNPTTANNNRNTANSNRNTANNNPGTSNNNPNASNNNRNTANNNPRTSNNNPNASDNNRNTANNNPGTSNNNRNTANNNPTTANNNLNVPNSNRNTANPKSPSNQAASNSKPNTVNSQASKAIEPDEKIAIIESFAELNDSILTDEELEPLLDCVKSSSILCKTTISNWADTYVMKLRPY